MSEPKGLKGAPEASEPGGTVSAEGVVGELRQILVQATGREELLATSDQTPLFGAGVGLDSLSGVMLLREVYRRFGVDVAAEDLNLDSLESLGTLAEFIAERLARDDR